MRRLLEFCVIVAIAITLISCDISERRLEGRAWSSSDGPRYSGPSVDKLEALGIEKGQNGGYTLTLYLHENGDFQCHAKGRGKAKEILSGEWHFDMNSITIEGDYIDGEHLSYSSGYWLGYDELHLFSGFLGFSKFKSDWTLKGLITGTNRI